MKYIFSLFICTLLLFSCKKEPAPPPDPLDASRIVGNWRDMTGTFSPDWNYQFEDGILTQSYDKFGAQLTTLTYPYAIRNDTIIIGGDVTNIARKWVVYFECQDVVKVTQVGFLFGQQFWLSRY